MRQIARAFLLFVVMWTMSCGFEETSSGPSGSASVPSSGPSGSGSVPAVPTEIDISAGDKQVTVQWKAVSGASSYNLYWSQTQGVSPATGTKIAGVSSPYVQTGLTNGETYYYVITAVNVYGESGKSAEVTITLNDAPPAPTGVSATSGEGQVIIAWNAVEKATTYNLYWSNGPDVRISGSTKMTDVTSPHTHGGLSNGSSYYYVVTAVNPYGESNISQEVYAIPHTDTDSARTRVVWIQEMGDGGADIDWSENVRLMGLDTEDGQGERVILGTLKNYAKPLITPRGNRVIYSDRIRKKIYVVNWDGSGLRELFGGFGLAVWSDPRDGREWIYYGSEEMRDGGAHCPAVYRALLDNPGAGELVWNKTPVSVDSFQVSADGRMAGGNFPWPIGGIAELPNGSLKELGSGCWTALATDNSYAFWIFDSQHRNLFIDDLSGEQGRWVNINGAPGVDGYEVYHPRWSNNPRVIAMTGPYKVGSGANRIAGGGREVEIYVGRFDANLTVIESWWQVTNNDRGDFFPDVWLSP